MDKFTQTGLVDDIRALDKLRQQSLEGKASQQQALEAAARQFESIFTQMWMKSMREANSVLTEESPMNSRYTEFYQGMLDQQMAASMSGPGGKTGLAALLVKQLSGASGDAGPAQPARELMMPETRLPVMRRFARWEGAATGNESGNESSSAADTKGGAGRGVAAAERFVAQLDAERQVGIAHPNRESGHFTSPSDFVRQLLPMARQVAGQIGLSPLALLAQAALETGWGSKMMAAAGGLSSRNLFGIKAGSRWQGAQAQVHSLEYENGKPVMRQSAFRAYDSFAQSMQDYVNLIGTHERYSQARAVAHDPEAYFDALQDAGYATDPHYAKKLKQVLHSDAFKGVWQDSEI